DGFITQLFTRSSIHSLGGVMPEVAGPGSMTYGNPGVGFIARGDGTWIFGTDSAGAQLGDRCQLGSIEGPFSSGGYCSSFHDNYTSVGTFDGWRRLPESGTVPLLGLGLTALVFSRRRLRCI